ncbi:MAG TPA: hypothetical protein VNA20_08715 [Frankiaceae bacterium]|nr:hypothetical protein [Frankiaceae bacterium]
MRRALSMTVVAAFAAVMVGGLAAPANAVCGGGQPGEPCYCPEYPLLEKFGISFNC